MCTFGDLVVGATFVFASEEDAAFRFSGMARGPWEKTSPRKYRHLTDPALQDNKVGSVGAKVRKLAESKRDVALYISEDVDDRTGSCRYRVIQGGQPLMADHPLASVAVETYSQAGGAFPAPVWNGQRGEWRMSGQSLL